MRARHLAYLLLLIFCVLALCSPTWGTLAKQVLTPDSWVLNTTGKLWTPVPDATGGIVFYETIPVDIPVIIMEGPEPGPTLVVSGCVHGAELMGAMGINEFLRTVNAKEIKVTIVLVPVANQSAFEFGIRTTQWDGMILNRQGLGKEDGAITERIAYHFVDDIVLKADAFVYIHSGTEDGFVWYTIARSPEGVAPEVRAMTRKMAVAFGLKDVMGRSPARWAGGYMNDVLKAGVPSIVVEIGGGGPSGRDWSPIAPAR